MSVVSAPAVDRDATGTLYLVGTPIGNLEDITLRALRILQTVPLIAAEDTRHTAKLLQHYGIATPSLSYHQHNRQQRQAQLLNHLRSGQDLALVSDAGMPAIADPGYDLVQACRQGGIAVVPIPGPVAAITGLCASGLPSDRFIFEGFLPPKGKVRRDRIQQWQGESRTVILYEAPHKLLRTLGDLGEILGGDRAILTARELTKRHEEFWQGTIAAAQDHYTQQPPRGEFTLILAGCDPASGTGDPTEAEIKARLGELLAQGMGKTEASRLLAETTPWSKREIYQWAIAWSEATKGEIST